MEAQAPFVRSKRTVHLDAEPAVDVDFARIVHPRHAEHDHPFGFDNPLQNLSIAIAGMALDDWPDRFDHLSDRLVEFFLDRVLGTDGLHEIVDGMKHVDLL